MYYFIRLWVIVMALFLTACGGGGGSAGSVAGSTAGTGSTPSTGTGTSAVTTVTLSVSDFALFTDKTSINNSGLDKAVLNVVAVDANRNVVPGATVSVSTDQNSVFTPASGAVTDATGSYVGNLTIGGDKSDRDVTLSVTVNSIVKKTSVRVSGSRLTLQASPSTPSPGQPVVVTASLLDSTGNPVPGVSITLGGDVPTLQNTVLVSGISGTVSTSITAPTASGLYKVTAKGAGVSSADYQLNVFSTVVPAAVIPGSASPSLSASPNVLAVNSSGSTANKSTLRFLFLDGANNPIPFVRVRFLDLTTGLGAVGASIASGGSTLYTDASGTVSTQYIAGQNSSPTNGVTVRACYSATDFASSNDCPSFVNASLTIAGQALAVSIGDDNLLTPGPGTYIKKFAVTVADSAGRAVANAPVDISVDLTHYGKGFFTSPFNTPPSDITAADPSLTAVPSTPSSTATSSTATSSTTAFRVWCPNEDTNRNGNVDPGENINGSRDGNGQPTLEPRKSDLIVSYNSPAVTTTDSTGVLVIKVEYSQRFATWLAYKVRVTANVSGSQGLAERVFVTQFIKGDLENGSFLVPPYGTGSCVNPN